VEEDSVSRNRELYANALFTGKLNGVDVTSNSSYQQERKILEKNVRKTFKNGQGSISIPAVSSDIQILGPYATSMSADAAGNVSIAATDGNLTVQDAKTQSGSIGTALLTDYGSMSNLEAFDSIINVSTATGLGESGYSDSYEYTELDGSKHTYQLRVVNSQNYELPSGLDYGIIVHTGTGVLTIDHDFTGLILSNGTINVKSGTSSTAVQIITSDHNTLSTILDEKSDFAKFFSAYYTPAAKEGSSIDGLDYDDFVSLRNWRKFDDEKTS
jgi:hypothetical protein